MKSVSVSVPASSANLGPGFDALGIALGLHNQIIFRPTSSGLTFAISGYGANKLPQDETNLVYIAAKHIFDCADVAPSGLHIDMVNAIPIASGLGSSSAALVGGMLAANALVGEPLTRVDILNRAARLEGHPDNVSPVMLGGLTATIIMNNEVHGHRHALPPHMRVVVATPRSALKTEESRALLPSSIPFKSAVHNIGRVPLVIESLKRGDYEMLAIAMHDKLHQPYRGQIIAGLAPALDSLHKQGVPAALSGAGPSLIAFPPDNHLQVAATLRDLFDERGAATTVRILPISNHGAQVKRLAH